MLCCDTFIGSWNVLESMQQATLPKFEPAAKDSSKKESNWNARLPLLALAAYWLFCFLFIGTAGNFPINDDWIYAESVEHLLKTGQLRLLACAPACIFQVVTAAAVCKVFGFSHVVLRTVGLAWAVLASYALYGSCRQLKASRAVSLMMTFCFVANPIFVCLAFSFMTDMPAIALTIAYTYFLLDGLRKDKASSFIYSALCLIAGTLVRQNIGLLGLVNAVIMLSFWLKRKHSWTLLLGLVIAPLATGYLADKWMVASNDFISLYLWYKGMVAKQVSNMVHAPAGVLPTLFQISGELLAYLGLFFLPVLLCFVPRFAASLRGKPNLINPAAMVTAATLMTFSLSKFIVAENRWMPFSQNLLRLPELGAHTILGINLASMSLKFRQTLTWTSGVLGFMTGSILIEAVSRTALNCWRAMRRQSPWLSRRAVMSLASVAIFSFFFAFTALQSTFSDIDRYYLFPFFGAILCACLAWRWMRVKLIPAVVVPVLLLIAGYSIAGTQDLMAWNRARWAGIANLEAKGINYKQIDGGAEYNYARDPQLFKNLILHDTWYEFTHRGASPRDQWRWWTVSGEDYIASFSPVPNYDVVDRQSYWSALSGKREILILKRIAESK